MNNLTVITLGIALVITALFSRIVRQEILHYAQNPTSGNKKKYVVSVVLFSLNFLFMGYVVVINFIFKNITLYKIYLADIPHLKIYLIIFLFIIVMPIFWRSLLMSKKK